MHLKGEKEGALNGTSKESWERSALACCNPPDAPLWLFFLGKSRDFIYIYIYIHVYINLRVNYINDAFRGSLRLNGRQRAITFRSRMYVYVYYTRVVTRVGRYFFLFFTGARGYFNEALVITGR